MPDRVTKTVAFIAITLLLSTATCLAQTYEGVCAELEIDDTFCAGLAANFPKRVCSYAGLPSVTSKTYCNPSFYRSWQDLCPNQNVNASQFCDGTGYFGPFPPLHRPCLLAPCKTNSDCTVHKLAPNAPVPTFKPLCYDCCLFCYKDAKCQKLPTYTNSTDCLPCVTTPEPITSDVPRQQSDNDGFKMSPWLYVAIASAIVAPLVLLFVLLFRRKCAKASLPGYDKLNGKTSVNMIEIEE